MSITAGRIVLGGGSCDVDGKSTVHDVHRQQDEKGKDQQDGRDRMGLVIFHRFDMFKDCRGENSCLPRNRSPTISTTPNSPMVWANPSTTALIYPRRAMGEATVRKASSFEARSDQAASRGFSDGFECTLERLNHKRHGIEDGCDHQACKSERERKICKPTEWPVGTERNK